MDKLKTHSPNVGLLLIEPLTTNFIEILIKILQFFTQENKCQNVVCKMGTSLLGLKVLILIRPVNVPQNMPIFFSWFYLGEIIDTSVFIHYKSLPDKS